MEGGIDDDGGGGGAGERATPSSGGRYTPGSTHSRVTGSDNKKYVSIHFTGYLKSWNNNSDGGGGSGGAGEREGEASAGSDTCNMACLVMSGVVWCGVHGYPRPLYS